MTAPFIGHSARRSVIVTMAALAVAVLLVWSASTGPAGLAEGVSSRTVVDQGPVRTVQPPQKRETTGSEQKVGETTSQRLGTGLRWLDDLVGIVAFLALLWVLAAVLRGVMNMIESRLPEKQLVVDLDPLPDLEAGRQAVSEDHDRLLDALHASDVRDGIVACWVLLEEAAAAAGVVRRPAETPTEFVVRFLHTLDVDPRPVAQLAGLYREARFSTHPMGADARRQAEDALAAVHEELSRTGAPA